jgi:hypothetical protein
VAGKDDVLMTRANRLGLQRKRIRLSDRCLLVQKSQFSGEFLRLLSWLSRSPSNLKLSAGIYCERLALLD